MANSSDFIKFDPVIILETSDILDGQYKLFTQSTAEIKSTVDSTKSSWQSDSATLYSEKIAKVDTKAAELGEQLLILSQDLASASGIYQAGEANAVQEAEGLPTEGIFRI